MFMWANFKNLLLQRYITPTSNLNVHIFLSQICIKEDSHDAFRMAYLFIESVGLHHSGTYTCKNKKNNNKKSVFINVQGK